MRKLLSIILACFITCSLVGCSNTQNQDQPEKEESVKNTLEILTKVWESYPDTDKFAATGGDYNHTVENAPGEFDINDKESLSFLLVVPDDAAAYLDQASSLMHAMNANTFTSAAFHITAAKNTETFVNSYKEALLNNQWMCGFPEQLLFVQINSDYVVSAFGNGEMIQTFKTALTKQYPSAKILAEENL